MAAVLGKIVSQQDLLRNLRMKADAVRRAAIEQEEEGVDSTATKILTLYGASKLWSEHQNLPDSDMLIRNEIASRCSQDSPKRLPDLPDDHAKHINYSVVSLSFETAMKEVAAAPRLARSSTSG